MSNGLAGSSGAGMKPLGVSIVESGRLLGVGRNSIYRLLREGRLTSFHCGARRLVTLSSIEKLASAAAGKEG